MRIPLLPVSVFLALISTTAAAQDYGPSSTDDGENFTFQTQFGFYLLGEKAQFVLENSSGLDCEILDKDASIVAPRGKVRTMTNWAGTVADKSEKRYFWDLRKNGRFVSPGLYTAEVVIQASLPEEDREGEYTEEEITLGADFDVLPATNGTVIFVSKKISYSLEALQKGKESVRFFTINRRSVPMELTGAAPLVIERAVRGRDGRSTWVQHYLFDGVQERFFGKNGARHDYTWDTANHAPAGQYRAAIRFKTGTETWTRYAKFTLRD